MRTKKASSIIFKGLSVAKNRLRTKSASLKQQPIRSHSFSSDGNYISTVNYKEINLDNTNMNTSSINNDLHDKSTDIVSQKSYDNPILEHLEKEVTTMLLSSVRAAKQAQRLVKLRRFKASVLQIQQLLLATPL